MKTRSTQRYAPSVPSGTDVCHGQQGGRGAGSRPQSLRRAKDLPCACVPTYQVERYWPGVTSERLLEALDRGRRVMKQMNDEGTRVRDISRILLPGEEVVFFVYEGPSAAAVRQFCECADIPASRIVEAIAVIQDHKTR
jgi:hypothetical protein